MPRNLSVIEEEEITGVKSKRFNVSYFRSFETNFFSIFTVGIYNKQ